jgi:hypothetical protein
MADQESADQDPMRGMVDDEGSFWGNMSDAYSHARDVARGNPDTREAQAKYTDYSYKEGVADELGGIGGTVVGDVQALWDYMVN